MFMTDRFPVVGIKWLYVKLDLIRLAPLSRPGGVSYIIVNQLRLHNEKVTYRRKGNSSCKSENKKNQQISC